MYEISNEKIKFLAHYREMFEYYFDDPMELERLKDWWEEHRAFCMSGRRTTSVDLFDWEFEVLDSLPNQGFLSNNSSKIRYLIKLGAIVHHLGLIHPEMMETVEYLKRITLSTDKKTSRKLSGAQEQLFGLKG
ncbi:MAG: hypothetical protein ACRCU6_01455 [Fusobacteriaceae bacterium]